MARRVVQRGEVVEVELDLRALEHAEAEAHEHVLDLPPGLRDEVQRSERRRRVARHGHVHAIRGQPAVELLRLERRGALGQQRRELGAGLVGLAAHPSALLGRKVADRALEHGQRSLATEEPHPDVLDLDAAPGRGDRAAPLLGELREARGRVRHPRPS
jgi:hypothetical protein